MSQYALILQVITIPTKLVVNFAKHILEFDITNDKVRGSHIIASGLTNQSINQLDVLTQYECMTYVIL